MRIDQEPHRGAEFVWANAIDRVFAGFVAAQMRTDARQQHGEFERLKHVIVCAGVQTLNLLLFFLRRARQHDDGRFDALIAQLFASLEAVHVRQADVQHDRGGLLVGGRDEAFSSRSGADAPEAIFEVELFD